MSRYLISFRDEAMDYREEEVADIAAAASEMTREAIAAGAFVFGGGIKGGHEDAWTVDEAGVVTDGPYPESKEHLGGFIVVDVDTLEEALMWAGKCASACRATMQVREMLPGAEAL